MNIINECLCLFSLNTGTTGTDLDEIIAWIKQIGYFIFGPRAEASKL